MIQITDTLAIDDREVEERFVRASGPGGQNVNKVATAVQLRFDVNASSLPDEVKTRLISLSGSRMTTEGVLVIDAAGCARFKLSAQPPIQIEIGQDQSLGFMAGGQRNIGEALGARGDARRSGVLRLVFFFLGPRWTGHGKQGDHQP